MASLTRALHGVIRATTPRVSAVSRLSSAAATSFKLPDLAYDFGALEPFIAGQIMEIHHKKHHQAYVTNLNVALEKYQKAEASGNIGEMIALQQAIRFNGGGHLNHSIFWQNLAPPTHGGGGEPTGDLAEYIKRGFGTFEVRRPRARRSPGPRGRRRRPPDTRARAASNPPRATARIRRNPRAEHGPPCVANADADWRTRSRAPSRPGAAPGCVRG